MFTRFMVSLYQLPYTSNERFKSLLRARPKAERVLAKYEDFLSLSDPTDRPDRDAFQRLTCFEPGYRLANGFRHLNATFNKSFALA